MPEDYAAEFDRLRKWAPEKDEKYPFSLICGRQVTTINSWLHARGKSNYCYINTVDAENLSVEDDDMVNVSSNTGTIKVPVRVTDDLMKGVVRIPHGWGRTVQDIPEGAVEKRGVNVNLITDDDWTKLEHISGMVMLDGIPVNIEPIKK